MNVTEFELPPQQGWICPKCGSVWAPWQAQCLNCVSSRTTFATGMTTNREVVYQPTQTVSTDVAFDWKWLRDHMPEVKDETH